MKDDAAVCGLVVGSVSAADCLAGLLFVRSGRCSLSGKPCQAGEVVGQIGERDFGGCPRLADGPDDEVQSPLLGGKDMLDPGPHPRPCGVAAADMGRHRLAARLSALELGN